MKSSILVVCGTILGVAYAFTGADDVGQFAAILIVLGFLGMMASE